MPHKRAKASIRKELSFQKGNDLPPNKLGTRPPKKKSSSGTSSSNHEFKDIPKNMYRILNSEKIRQEYKQRIKEKDEKLSKDESNSNHSTKSKKSNELRIEHGEKLSDFNQRVEEAMRSKVSSVMKIARNKSIIKKPKPTIKSNETNPTEESITIKPIKETKKPKEFEPKPTKFSLNDIVMEPPIDLKKPSKKLSIESKKLPISNAQKRLIEEEREKAIKRYRQLKEERLRGVENNES